MDISTEEFRVSEKMLPWGKSDAGGVPVRI
jgi:hypothetical protein